MFSKSWSQFIKDASSNFNLCLQINFAKKLFKNIEFQLARSDSITGRVGKSIEMLTSVKAFNNGPRVTRVLDRQILTE